jgi:hypothetical protein
MSAEARFLGRRRGLKELVFAIGLAAFFAAYTSFLDYQENQVRLRMEELRSGDPDTYLSQVRTIIPFDRYIEEYRMVKGYGELRAVVPSFLLGRWALFADAKRVSDSYLADDCTDSIAFEDGRAKAAGEVAWIKEARYRLDGSTVIVELQNIGEIPVRLVSYGERLHHIEFDLPGYDGRRYGYLCK